MIGTTFLVNLILFSAYTYKYVQPVYIYVYDPIDWLKETVNLPGFIPPLERRAEIIDPWAIKLKSSFLAFPIDYLPIINCAISIFNFLLDLIIFDGYQGVTTESGVTKEDRFTTASLA